MNKKRQRRSYNKAKHVAKAVSRLDGKPVPLSDADLIPMMLSSVAHGLNALEQRGVKVHLAHGALITDWGYVFRIGDDQLPWEVRTRSLTTADRRLPVSPGDDD